MSQILKILKISRYRFWSYTAGPFLLGSLLATDNTISLNNWQFFLVLMFFLIPANIFLYGVNDLFDEDTDKYNQKKDDIENRLKSSDKYLLKISLAISAIMFMLLLSFTPGITAKIILLLFLFLSYFYSAKPLRFKSKPFIDSLSNILYILPGVYAYTLISGNLPPLLPLIGLGSWAAAMHLFSAIPDIEPDKKAHLKTTAVLIGKTNSLILCTVLWLIFFNILNLYFSHNALIIFIIYPLIPLILLIKKSLSINKVYWYFPSINLTLGFLAFILIVINKL